MLPGFIAVHVGAGYHEESLRPEYKNACKQACDKAVEMLRGGCTAVQIVTEAVAILEDCSFTNAGTGSNLTLAGTVESDAGVMDGATLRYGTVGALSNIKNPVLVAKGLVEQQKKGLLSCGRIPPSSLFGKGALDWALNHGFSYIDNKDLITEMSEKNYKKNLNILQQSSEPFCEGFNTSLIHDESQSFQTEGLLDAVGAICVDSFGNVSSAVSSGGLSLKHLGRIGHSAIYGAGFWAQNSYIESKPSIACSVSGSGEHLIKTMLAKECYKKLSRKLDDLALIEVFNDKFIKNPCLKDVDNKLAGILTLKHYSHNNICQINWIHNTKSMILGWSSAETGETFIHVSERAQDGINFSRNGITI